MSNTKPGAVPRGCYTTYRGNLAADARKVERESGSFATARIGVNMAAPDVPTEARERLTEWVNVIAFTDALQVKLLKCKKGDLICVMGNVTRKFYQTQAGEEGIDRTIIADAMMGPSSSRSEPSAGRVDPAADPGAPPAE